MTMEKIVAMIGIILLIGGAVYLIGTIIGNVFLFKAIGKNRVLAFIPVVNKYITYKFFWSKKAFWVYFISAAVYIMSGTYNLGNEANLIYNLSYIILFIVEFMSYDKIRKAYGKHWGWLVGLVVCYPVFIIILALKGTLEPKFQEKITKKP